MNILRSIFSKDGEWSSKRVIGVGGLIVILGCYIYCCLENIQMPSVTEFLAGCFVTLLGVDPVCDTVNKLKNGNESKSDTDTEG